MSNLDRVNLIAAAITGVVANMPLKTNAWQRRAAVKLSIQYADEAIKQLNKESKK